MLRLGRRLLSTSASTAAGRAYLAQNATREGVTVTATGLQYRVLGSGPADAEQPHATSVCECHFRGRFVDGAEFDSSYQRLGAPAIFVAGEQLQGWREALLLMRAGDKWELTLPPELAYGDADAGPIPANSVLIYELELLKVSQQQDEPSWVRRLAALGFASAFVTCTPLCPPCPTRSRLSTAIRCAPHSPRGTGASQTSCRRRS